MSESRCGARGHAVGCGAAQLPSQMRAYCAELSAHRKMSNAQNGAVFCPPEAVESAWPALLACLNRIGVTPPETCGEPQASLALS